MSKLVIVVDFELQPGAAARFMPLMQTNAEASLRDEPGCLQFDVLIPEDNAKDSIERVFLYEVYVNAKAFEEHLKTAHFLSFKAAVSTLVKSQTVQRYLYA